jgi:hypothetical protein
MKPDWANYIRRWVRILIFLKVGAWDWKQLKVVEAIRAEMN